MLTISKARKGRKAYPKGAYYADNLLPEHALIDVDDLGDAGYRDANHPVCPRDLEDGERKHLMAETFTKLHIVIFCPPLLNNQYWSIDSIPQRIVPGQTDPIVFDTTIAKLWLHEMVHYVMKCKLPPDLLHFADDHLTVS